MKQKRNYESGWPSWDIILAKLDQILELMKVIKEEKQLYRKQYEETKK